MKIAITTSGTDLRAQIDPRFGRAAGFIVYDTDTSDFTAIDNQQNLNAVQGAGIQAAKTIFDLDVKTLITGHCGPKAFRALNTAGIEVLLCDSGTVAEAIEKYHKSELQVSTSADVEGHWS